MGKTDNCNRLNKIETVEEGVIRFFDEKKELLPEFHPPDLPEFHHYLQGRR